MIRQTSLLSFAEMLKKTNERQAQYLEALHGFGYPATDLEITRFAGHSDPNYFRPRRNELVKMGLIIECPKRECSVSHKTALTWWFA